MKRNMRTADRVIRTLIAIGIAVLYFTGRISGVLAIILGAVAVAFLLSSLVGRCPGYLALGLSTHKEPPGSPGA
jgi:K+-transporting ATPase A subunit